MILKSVGDLKALKDNTLKKISVRFKDNTIEKEIKKHHIMVCSGTGCHASKSNHVMEKLEKELKKRSLIRDVKVFKTGCFGFCKLGPIIVIHPDRTFYCKVEPDHVDEIIEQHIQNGKAVKKLLYHSMKDGSVQEKIDDIDFFNHQMRIALNNCGLINPEDINEYIAVDGYMAFANIIENNTSPEAIIEEIKKSGLRGRGGGGFSTGQKWEYAASYKGDEKYILCNADEGDPGAFMDRSILEGDPHSIIEAMMIAGYCIGAGQGYIYM